MNAHFGGWSPCTPARWTAACGPRSHRSVYIPRSARWRRSAGGWISARCRRPCACLTRSCQYDSLLRTSRTTCFGKRRMIPRPGIEPQKNMPRLLLREYTCVAKFQCTCSRLGTDEYVCSFNVDPFWLLCSVAFNAGPKEIDAKFAGGSRLLQSVLSGCQWGQWVSVGVSRCQWVIN